MVNAVHGRCAAVEKGQLPRTRRSLSLLEHALPPAQYSSKPHSKPVYHSQCTSTCASTQSAALRTLGEACVPYTSFAPICPLRPLRSLRPLCARTKACPCPGARRRARSASPPPCCAFARCPARLRLRRRPRPRTRLRLRQRPPRPSSHSARYPASGYRRWRCARRGMRASHRTTREESPRWAGGCVVRSRATSRRRRRASSASRGGGARARRRRPHRPDAPLARRAKSSPRR